MIDYFGEIMSLKKAGGDCMTLKAILIFFLIYFVTFSKKKQQINFFFL